MCGQLVEKVVLQKKLNKLQTEVYVHAFQRVVGVQRAKPLVALRRERNSLHEGALQVGEK